MSFFPPGYGEPPGAAATLQTDAAAANSGSSGGDATDYLQYVSLARELVLPSDPEERRGVIEAKIKNYKGMKRKFPLLATFYDNEIRKLRAKLKATQGQIAKKKRGEQSTQTFRYLGWAAGGLLVVLLGTMIYKNVVTARTAGSK
jgi:hypothetical protein